MAKESLTAVLITAVINRPDLQSPREHKCECVSEVVPRQAELNAGILERVASSFGLWPQAIKEKASRTPVFVFLLPD